MQKISFILILVTFCHSIKSWNQTIEIQGIIVDHSTSLPIPFSTVGIKNSRLGVATGTSGNFMLTIPPEKKENAELIFRALGYKDTLIILDNYLDTRLSEVRLIPQVFSLKEVIVRPSTGELTKGLDIPVESEIPYLFKVGAQVAVYMDNEEKVDGIIKSASFYILASGKYKAPFRVRVYERSESGAPGRDLLNKNVIVSAQRKSDWTEVDLEKYRIPVPKNGYFIAMEWVLTDNKFIYKDKYRRDKKERLYGQNLGRTIKSEKPISWNGNFSGRWMQDTFQFRENLYANALIKSTIHLMPK